MLYAMAQRLAIDRIGISMRNIKAGFIAPFLMAGAAAAVIVTAPNASAADARTCANGGAATICQNPGNAEIHAAPPEVSAPRIYGQFASPYPFLFN